MSAKLPGKGTTLGWKTGGAFVTVGGTVSLDGPKPELKMRDVTDLSSATITSRPAIGDPGTLSGTLFFDPSDANQIVLRAKILTPSQTPDEFKITYADGNTTPANDDFKGFLTKWDVNGIEVEGSVQANFEIRISDQFTSTVGTP